MALTLDGTAGITFPVVAGSASAVQASSGKVLQVVNGTYTTYTSTTSSSFVATGVTTSITPSSSTSKILVTLNANGITNPGSSGQGVQFAIYKNGSIILNIDNAWGYPTNVTGSAAYQYLDSPATTSATTYTLYWKSAGGGTIYINNYLSLAGGTLSTITLMEIAA